MGILELLESTNAGKYILTFLMAMAPVIELRGAIPTGVSLGLPVLHSAAVSILGNLIPVPFIIIFIRKIFAWMKRKNPRLGHIAQKLENKAKIRGQRFYKGELIGLLIFVAIPLPGTGAWTGALIAAILNLRLKAAFPAISAGVLIAGILVTGITYGFKALFT